VKFATKITQHYPPHLRHVAALPWDIKIQIFANIQQIWKNANKLHFQYTDFNSCTRVTVYAESIYVFLSKSCPLCWMSCWLLTNTAVTSAVMNFRCHRLIAKVNKQKNTVTQKIFFAIIMGKSRYLRHRKYQNLWINNKVSRDKNAISLHFSTSAEYLQNTW